MLVNLGFRCRIIRDNFPVFGVKIHPEKMHLSFIKDNAQFITTNNK